MSRRPFIIDTNVLVAGLISSSASSPTVRLVDAMLDGSLSFLLSPALLDECRAVLLRPKLRRAHGLSEAELDALLADIVANAIWLEPPPAPTPTAPDANDQHLWHLLAHEPKAILVTGDQLLLAQPRPGSGIVTPAGGLGLLNH